MPEAKRLASDLENLALEKAKWGFEAISTTFLQFLRWHCRLIWGEHPSHSVFPAEYFKGLFFFISWERKTNGEAWHILVWQPVLFNSLLSPFAVHLQWAVHRGIWELTWCFSLGKALNHPFYARNVHSHLWGKNLTEKDASLACY